MRGSPTARAHDRHQASSWTARARVGIAKYHPARVMPRLRPSPRAAALVAIAVLVLGYTVVVQSSGPNQAAHFALVRALAGGTAEIDPRETIDASYVDGRFYAAKAPGLALFTLPWYGALRVVGLQDTTLETSAGYSRRLWEVNLFGAVLPALVLLLLVFAAVERVVPGLGGPTAVLLGAGTMLLPFATLFFDHTLAAALGFAAFVLLLRERDGPRRTELVGVAGLLAGLAIVVEFPLALVALVLAAYAAARDDALRRTAAYACGLLVGLVPLLAYNTWAFGSPFRLSYTNALVAPVTPGEPPAVGANDEGLYGVGLPDPRAALSLLVSEKGLLIVAPLAILALAGLPLLWRTGRRAETLVCGGTAAVFLVYNAAYYLPWGGQAPGPRFLVPALPFLSLPLGLLLRARPLAVAGMGIVSVSVTALATITDPLTGEEHGLGLWWERLRSSDLADTVATRLGVDSPWSGALPFFLAIAIACGVGLSMLPLRGRLRAEGPLLAGLVGGWAVVALVGPDLVPASEKHGTLAGALAVAVVVLLVVVALVLGDRYGPVALLPAVPALLLAAPVFDERPRLALLTAGGIVGLAAAVWVPRRAAWRPVRVTDDVDPGGRPEETRPELADAPPGPGALSRAGAGTRRG